MSLDRPTRWNILTARPIRRGVPFLFGFRFGRQDAEPEERMRRSTDTMPELDQTLDRAQRALRRSARRVRGRAPGAAPAAKWEDFEDRPVRRRGDSALDQSVAALQAVVWIASFVQGVFNEIRGRSDDL